MDFLMADEDILANDQYNLKKTRAQFLKQNLYLFYIICTQIIWNQLFENKSYSRNYLSVIKKSVK